MNKITLICLTAAIALLSSCNNEEIVQQLPQPENSKATLIIAMPQEDPTTRIAFNDEETAGVKLTWEAEDKIMLYDAASNNYAATFQIETGKEGEATAQFGVADGTVVSGQTYTAVYPAIYLADGTTPAPTLSQRIEIINGKTQTNVDDLIHLDEQCYMTANLTYNDPQTLVTFAHQYAMLTVEIGTPSGYIAGTHGAPVNFTFFNGGNTILLTLSGIEDCESTFKAYMLIEPITPKDTEDKRDLRFQLLCESGDLFEKEIPLVNKAYIAGRRYTAKLTESDKLELNTSTYATVADAVAAPAFATGQTVVITEGITESTDLSTLAAKLKDNNIQINLVLPNATALIPEAFKDCISLASVNMPKVEDLSDGVFQSCTNLAAISAPEVINVMINTFLGCTSLTSISLPKATNLKQGAFFSCIKLTSINLPKVKTITGESVFSSCTSLTSISLPLIIDSEATRVFSGCTSLTNVNLPAIKVIGNNWFHNCTSLTSISLPAAETIGASACASSALPSISLPEATNIGNNAFGNTPLTILDLPKVTSIAQYALDIKSTLTTLKIATTSGGLTGTVGANLFGYNISNRPNIDLIVGTGETIDVDAKTWTTTQGTTYTFKSVRHP